jgi:hypothetical protein
MVFGAVATVVSGVWLVALARSGPYDGDEDRAPRRAIAGLGIVIGLLLLAVGLIQAVD